MARWLTVLRGRAVAPVAVAAMVVAGSAGTAAAWWVEPAHAAVSAQLVPRAMFTAPVADADIVRLFERPPERWSPGHRGLDFSAQEGQLVTAPGAGVVTHAGTVVDRGTVTVLHPNGLRSSLEPVEVMVEVGETVASDQVLGTVQVGHHHCHPHVCVHWGLREGDEYLNPLDWLIGFGPVRLLPLFHAHHVSFMSR